MLAFFVLFLGICVLHSEARDSANTWRGSKVLLVTDFLNATVSIDKLRTSLADRSLADVFSRLTIVQRGQDGRFTKSHGSFTTLSRIQDRKLTVSNKEILPWLLEEDANVIICVADSKADVPQILISAQRKGMFPLDTELMIWMIQGDVMAADGMKMTSVISPGDFDHRSSSLDDEDRFSSRKVRLISAKNLESAMIELFQTVKGNVHHRERRNAGQFVLSSMSTNLSGPSLSSAIPQSLSSSVRQSVSGVMTTKVSAGSASPPFSQSLSSSMTTKVSSSSFAAGQSVSSPVTTQVIGLNPTPSVVQSVSSSLPPKISPPGSSPPIVQSVSSSISTKLSHPSSSASFGQSVSSSMTTKVSGSSSNQAVVQPLSSPMSTKVLIPSSSSAVGQSASTPSTTTVPIPISSPAIVQSVSSSKTPRVSIPSSSAVVVQTVSSSTTIDVPFSSSSSSPAVGQSASSSNTTKVSISSVSQPGPSSVTIKVPILSSSPAVSQSESRSITIKVPILSSSPAVSQSESSSMTMEVPIPSSGPAVSQSVSSSMTIKIPVPSSSPAFVQSVSSSVTTKVSKVSTLTSSPAEGQTVSKSLTTQVVAPSSSASAAPVVSSSVGQSTSVPVTTKVTAPTATLPVSPSISSSVAVRPTESQSMVVNSFTETQGTTLTVHIKPSSSVASLSSSSISPFSSSQPSETLGPSLSSSSTPLNVLSSSMTSGSTGLSTSAVILPTSTKREPLPLSSSAVVTEKPPVYENETIVIEFAGNCQDVVGHEKTKKKFQREFVRVVAEKLGIQKKAIAVNDIVCGSIRVTFTISGTSGKANVSQALKKLVDNGDISVTVNNKTFTATKLEVVQRTTPPTLAPTTEGKKSEIAFILYITFGALMALIFIVGFVILVARCRRDRREGSFFLPPGANYELRRFQGIPLAGSQYSRVNYYGEPVEQDAAAPDPNADDEFHPHEVASPTGGSAAASNPSDAKEEKFDVGMPEWKNLPKLSVKEVSVAEPSEDIPKSSGSVGSRQLLLDNESPQEDLRHAYDNPVVTFGDGPTGLDKEDQLAET